MQVLVARFEDTAAASPGKTAIRQGARSLDYRGLRAATLRMAGALRGRGVRAGDRVALALPNGIEAAIAWYGTWRAGGVVVPLDPQARERDLVHRLRHSGARLLLHASGQGDAQRAADATGVPVMVPDEGGEFGAGSSHEPAGERMEMPDAAALAAILYTSGTTGDPKGVALSHRNLAANADSIIDYLGLGPDDSTVSVLPFHYAYGASVLHTHLAVGARIVLEDNLVFPHLVTAALARERATGFSGVPSTFALLLERGRLEHHDLSTLRYLTQAGGAMPPGLTRRVRDAFPRARLFLMYGQTEASARLTRLAPEHVDDKPGSVGTPIAGVEIRVRRADGSDAAPGETGDVWARGDNVMTGYWDNPAATSATLVDGWLRTGDIGHLDAEGFLWLAGRRSDMIKTGAHRVHPQDIEEVIAELPGVREVAVAGVEDALLGQVVAAFLVRDGDAPDEIAVKAHCRQRLAGYKIPKQVSFVAELPRTASGKVRRTALAQEFR